MSEFTAVALGRPSLARDLTTRVLEASGVEVCSADEDLEHSAVVVMVDPEPGDWESARKLGLPSVVVTSGVVDDAAVIELMSLGADAVVQCGADAEELLEAASVVRAGGSAVTAAQARLLAEAVRTRGESGADRPQLTARELDILWSVDRGESVKQTARALGISVKTVENLQTRLFRKLDVRNRAQAVAVAHAMGLLADAALGV